MKKLISLLLALMLVCSLIPMAASAAEEKSDPTYIYKNYVSIYKNESENQWYGITEGGIAEKIPNEVGIKVWYDYLEYMYALEEYARTHHEPGQHKYSTQYNAKYHWLGCPCGCKIGMERHIDPKDAKNDYCTCGYHFSDNADLVTLWIDGCPPIKNFNKNTTEYELKAYTYKDVKEIKVSTNTFDSEATVELPEDLTLKEGENTFEIKVVAENQKVTKTYTVTIIKEAK